MLELCDYVTWLPPTNGRAPGSLKIYDDSIDTGFVRAHAYEEMQ